MTRVQSIEKLSPFSYGIRAVTIIATTVAATVLGLMLSRPEYQTHTFFWRNTADTPGRLALVVVPFASGALAGLVFAGVWVLMARKRWDSFPRARHGSSCASWDNRQIPSRPC